MLAARRPPADQIRWTAQSLHPIPDERTSNQPQGVSPRFVSRVFAGGYAMDRGWLQQAHLRISAWKRSLCAISVILIVQAAEGEVIVPGTGQRIDAVGDDFEVANWEYLANSPKSSRNIDQQEHGPLARSRNGRWLEGPHRGTPDLLRIVPTPRGGIEGSENSLQIMTLRSGMPESVTHQPQQDDLMVQVKSRLRHLVPASWEPSCVVRVHIPPLEQWEDRTGVSFGFRLDLFGSKKWDFTKEQYWPGMFFAFRSKTSRGVREDSAHLLIRADQKGRDLRGPEIPGPGWWTLGMSVSSDGKCHYFAREGVGELTAADHITSQYCYGYKAKHLELFFFNIVTMDDGQTWSTPWIIDDPAFYCNAPIALTHQTARLR